MWVCLFWGLCRFTCFCTWSPAPASVCLILCVWQMHTQRTLQREKGAATISGKPQICFRIIKHGFFSGSLLQTDIFIFIILFENIDINQCIISYIGIHHMLDGIMVLRTFLSVPLTVSLVSQRLKDQKLRFLVFLTMFLVCFHLRNALH